MSKPLVRRDGPAGTVEGRRAAWGPRSEAARNGDHDDDVVDLRDRPMAGRKWAFQQDEEVPKPGSSGTGSSDADPREAAEAEGDAHGRFATSPTQLPKAGWKDVARRTLQEVKADNVPITAAGVAFYGMLALAPAMVALVSIYGLVTSPDESAKQVEGLTSALPGEAARLLVDQLKSITGADDSGLGVKLAISLVGLLWSASSGTTALIRGLGIAYDEPEGRGFVKLRSRALILTVLAIIGAVLVLGLTVALPAILDAAGFSSVGKTVGLVLRWPLIGLLGLVALGALYRYGPDRDRARWRWVSPGAVLAALLWVIGTGLFAFYAGRFASYNETYGTLAGAVVLLLWLYLTALAVLVGAELNSELERQTLEDSTVGPPAALGERTASSADSVGAAAPSRR
jgi:membrane protein